MASKAVEVSRFQIWKRRIIILLIAALVFLVAGWFFVIYTEANQVLREAKNVRISMKLVAIEKYGEGTSIYDPTAYTGLAAGAAQEIAETSGESGKITLTAWNTEQNIPKSFTYRKGDFYAEYVANGDKFKSWKVYFNWKLLDFTGDS